MQHPKLYPSQLLALFNRAKLLKFLHCFGFSGSSCTALVSVVPHARLCVYIFMQKTYTSRKDRKSIREHRKDRELIKGSQLGDQLKISTRGGKFWIAVNHLDSNFDSADIEKKIKLLNTKLSKILNSQKF